MVGFLGLTPETQGQVGSFVLGFITLPEALAQMPGAQIWSVIFFFTLFLLAVSSAFVLMDCLVTAVADTDRFSKTPRVYLATSGVVIAFLFSLIYNTEFGPQLLDGIDLMTNNIVLPFTVFAECYGATVLYRSIDVVGQVGIPAFAVNQLGFLGGMLVGLVLAHNISIGAGIGAGFGMFFALNALSVLIAKTPDSQAPRFWGKNVYLERLWWLAFYSVRLLGSSRSTDILTVHTGQSTQARSQRHSPRGQKLAVDMVLGNLSTLHLLPNPRHRLLLQLPYLHGFEIRPSDNIPIRDCASRNDHDRFDITLPSKSCSSVSYV